MSDTDNGRTVRPGNSEKSSSKSAGTQSYEIEAWSQLEISEAQEFLDSVKDFFGKEPAKYDSFHALSCQRTIGKTSQQAFWDEAKKLLFPALMEDLRKFMPKGFVPIDELPRATVFLMGRDRKANSDTGINSWLNTSS